MSGKNPKNKELDWGGRRFVIENLAKRLSVSYKVAENIYIILCEELTVALCNNKAVVMDDLITLKVFKMDGFTSGGVIVKEVPDYKKVVVNAHRLLRIRVNGNNPEYKTDAKAEYAAKMEARKEKRMEKKRVKFD